MNNKIVFIVYLGCALLLSQSVLGAQPKKSIDANSENVTVITSERMVYDSQNQSAVFEENVVVTDPKLKLSSDKLTVEFDESSKVEEIQAQGSVYIEQEDKRAWAESADYNVVSGKMVLRGEPLIRQGEDMLQGDTITFWRDQNRMVCEPNARLTIFSQDVGIRNSIEGKQ